MARPRDPGPGFVAGPLLSREEILGYLADLAAVLEERGASPVSLVLVGGSYLALRELREATRDIDSATRLSDELRDAALVVAKRHGLNVGWLNDRARSFLPADFDQSCCSVLVEYPQLVALGPPPDDILMMKAYAAREADLQDMVRLWPFCSFTSSDEAARRFSLAYPHAPDDPYLSTFFEDIARRAEAAASGG